MHSQGIISSSNMLRYNPAIIFLIAPTSAGIGNSLLNTSICSKDFNYVKREEIVFLQEKNVFLRAPLPNFLSSKKAVSVNEESMPLKLTTSAIV